MLRGLLSGGEPTSLSFAVQLADLSLLSIASLATMPEMQKAFFRLTTLR
jgi:hypothetical protein